MLYTGLTSGADGLVRDSIGRTSITLPFGTYEIIETKAPEGYTMLTQPVTMTVGNSGVAYIQNNYLGGETQQAEFVNNGYLLAIINYPGYELPHTGGPGTAAIHLAGILIMIGAMAGMYWRRHSNC